MLHIMLGMQSAVVNETDVFINELQLEHFFVVSRTGGVKTM
ncbi:hypothetical protein VIC_001585 [Vibrio coralliilyticus ATCC BAA-450]|nr:hypothetical protein VIC_001585 [Vibrio coralliilyticus ATCC BAA-450]